MLGRSVGNYQLVSKIGEGGMGVVYLARHVALGRSAAVKVLLPEMSANPDIVARFFNEARAATAVRNPGIVEVFDFGFLDERCAYIVMEYLEGESLAARIRRGRSTVMATLTIVRAIARSLQAAHERGIVHRDLKPDNVFLVPDPDLPSGERVKILDFGIAKLASVVGEASHTRTGAVMGTPTYMAPEQCRGAGTVDHRADLYALGCVAYEMLCGQPPFVAEGAGDIIARHLYFQPAPLRSYRPDIPSELDDLVLWLLQKDPQGRPATAADLIRAVDHLAALTPPVVARGEQVMAGANATRPMVMDTTLSGAASTSTMPQSSANSTRVRIIAASVTAVIALFIAILWTRGGQDRIATGSSIPEVATAGEPKGREVAGSSTVTAPAGPASQTARGSADDVAALVNAVKSTAPSPPDTTMPLGAAGQDDTAKVSGAAKVTEVAKPVETARSSSRAKSSDAAKPSINSKSIVVVRPHPADKTTDAEAAASAAKPADAACTRVAFAVVLDADAPDEAAVQGALGRLRRCKATMKSDLYEEIQRQLIAKL